MSRITWDDSGKKLYTTGIEKGVLYIPSNDKIYYTSHCGLCVNNPQKVSYLLAIYAIMA